jgi:hypothetical protein
MGPVMAGREKNFEGGSGLSNFMVMGNAGVALGGNGYGKCVFFSGKHG